MKVLFLKKLLSCSFHTILNTNSSFLFRKISSAMVIIPTSTVAMAVVWNKLVECRETQGWTVGGK